MKTAFLSSLLLLLVGVASAASSNCKALCKDSRQSILNDITSCKPALKQNNSKNFHLCVEGRKKSYDQACVSVCSNAELTVSSFDGCQPVAKSGSQALSWCRRGYDSILHTLGPLLGELESSELLLEVEEEVGELAGRSGQTEVVQEQEQKSSEPAIEHEQPIKVVESKDGEETPVEEPVKTFEVKQEPMKNVDSVVDSALQMDDDQSVDANAGDAAEQTLHTSYESEDAAANANLHEHYSDSTSNVDEQQDTEFEL